MAKLRAFRSRPCLQRVDVEGFRWRNLRAFQGVEDASVWSRGAGVTMGSDGEELSCSAEEWGLAQWCKIKCAWLVAKLADDARLRIKIGRMGTVPPLIKLLSEVGSRHGRPRPLARFGDGQAVSRLRDCSLLGALTAQASVPF